MEWNMLFDQGKEPTMLQMREYVGSAQSKWDALGGYLQQTYQVQPHGEYSTCSAQPGWNVKYKKSGKALCTLYPLEDSFIALVVVGPKDDEQVRFEMEAQMYTPHVRAIFAKAKPMAMGRWLMIEAVDDATLEDIKQLIAIRMAKPNKDK